MKLPADHPLRQVLNDEVHARPPPPLTVPCRISFLALTCDPDSRKAQRAHLSGLCERYGVAPPSDGASHFAADFGPFRLHWERHSEFARYMVVAEGAGEDPFASPAIAALPQDWVRELIGATLVATHVAILADTGAPLDPESVSRRYFKGNVLIGAPIVGEMGSALTDFRIHEDGFGRVVIHVRRMTPRQIGRSVQRLVEIDAYRMMALLAFPVARGLSAFMGQCEKELAAITAAMARLEGADEPALLSRLNKLEAEIQARHADNHFRFSAASAYFGLVEQRIEDLREGRFEGVQTFQEFTARRLVPAVSTVRSVARQLDGLSERVARATQSLSTRIAVTREGQSQALLEQMARRAKMQLRLQQTVEGLSLAAISYYVVGLVGYLAKGGKAAGMKIDPELLVAASIPVVVALLAYGLRKAKRHLDLDNDH